MKDLPKVGFGTWEIVGEEVDTAIKSAIKTGYKHIDTAQIYNNEYQIGQTLKEIKVNYEDIFITSKVTFQNYRYHTYESVKESIRRLNIKKINLMLLHSPLPLSKKDDIVIAYKELMRARKDGLVDMIGVSNFNVELLEIIKKECGEYPFINQIVLAPTVIIEDVEKFCKKNGIKLTGYSTLRSYFNPNPWYEGSGMSDDQKERINELAKKYNKNVGQILSRWALDNGYYIIPKSINPLRIESNFLINDFQLSEEEIKELNDWNTYTSKMMIDSFVSKLTMNDEEFDQIQRKGLLYEKNIKN